MAVLPEKNGAFEQNLVLTDQDLTISLPVSGKYVDKNIVLNVSARSGDVRIPTDASVEVTPTVEIDESTGTVTASISTTEYITPQVRTEGWVSSQNISAGEVTIEGSSQLELGVKTYNDLTASGATVTVPKGYYPAQASKSISNGTLQLTGGDLSAGSGYVSLSNDGLYHAAQGSVDTSEQMNISSTVPSDTADYYQVTITGSGQVNRAAANAQVTKNGYLTSSTNKSIAADTLSSNTQTTSYYVPKATRNVQNGTVEVTPGSVTVTPSGIITSQTETDYSLGVAATGGNATVGASTVTVSAGYNPTQINASSAQRNITGQSVNETVYIQEGAIEASISANVDGEAEMEAHGFTPLASGTSNYYVELSTTPGTVQAQATTETEGYIKNLTDTTSAVNVDVAGDGDKLYLNAATLGSEGSVTTAPSVAITNSTTMQTTSSNTGYSFTVSGTPSDGLVQTKYKATEEGYTPVRTATDGGIVNVTPNVSGATTINIKRSTYSNTATSGVTYTDVTDNSTILTSNGNLYINEGYTPNSMISLAHLIPDDANLQSNASMLEGVTAYDSNGVLYTGTIPTKTSEDITVSGKSVNTPAGYYATAVTQDVAVGSVTSPNATATIGTPNYNAGTGNFSISASGSIAQPTVNTAGYISTTEGTRTGGTISGSTTLNKIGIKSTNSGKTSAVTPVISKKVISIEGVVDAAGGAATTSTPSGGVYVAVQSAEDKGNLVSTPGVSSAGYGTTSQYTATTATSEVGANASNMTYIPITTTTATKSGATVSYGSGWITAGSTTVDSGDYSAAVSSHSISAPVVSGKLAGTITNIGTTTKPGGTNGTDYWTITPSSEVTTVGKSTAVAEADIDTAGWIMAGNKSSGASNVNITPTTADGSSRYLIKAAIGASSNNATATTTVAPGTVSINEHEIAVTNKTRLAYSPSTNSSDISKYYIAVQATAAANDTGATSSISGTVTASVSEAGYAPLTLTGSGSVSGTATAKTSQKQSSVYYIPVPTAAFTTSNNKVYCSTAGYVPQGSTSNVVGTVTAVTPVNNTTLPSGSTSSGSIPQGKYIKIPKGYIASDMYYLATADSGNYTVTGSGTNISVDGKATISVASSTMNLGITSVSTTAATRGIAQWGAGWITAGNIPAATFANSATENTEYVDISATTDAPIIPSGGYLYINQGYVDNLKISLAKLVPNGASVGLAAGHILSGYTAYDSDGTLITGNIPTKTSENVSHSGKTVTIPAGYYASQVTHDVDSGTYSADSSASSNSAVTPSLGLDTTASSYGFTTTQPSTGTTGTNYLTLNPNAEATAWSVTPRATISAAGYIAKGSTTGTAVSQKPTVAAGTNYYVPVVSPSFTGGTFKTPTTNTNVVTAPTVTFTSSGSFKSASTYGVTTTKPSGTDGNSFLTITGSAESTTGSATSTVKVGYNNVTFSNSAGVIAANAAGTVAMSGKTSSNITKTTEFQAAIDPQFGTYYIPIVNASFSGGAITSTGYTKNDLAVTLASGSETNLTSSTMKIGTKDTTTYPYYFKVNGSTPAISANTSVTIGDVKYSVDAGAIAAANNATAKTFSTATPAVSVNAASGSTYISFKKATMTVAGTNTVTPSASLSKDDGITWSDTNNGLSITATGGGTASVTATATTNVTGYAPASTQLGSATLNAASNTTTAVKYITGITVPKAKTFTISTAANTAADSAALTVTNNAYRTTNVTNAANGTLTITNNGTISSLTNAGTITAITNNASKTITNIANNGAIANINNGGTVTVTSKNATTGSLTVSAYNASGTIENNKSIVSNGKWVTPSVSAAGTYYGRVTIGSGSASADFTNANISTYFNSGTSSSYSISITPRYSTNAGYVGNASAQAGTTTYYSIKTASPTFSAAPTGGSTATAVSSSCSISNSTNNSGVAIQTKYSISAVNISYAAASTGWIDKAANATTGSQTTAKGSTNGTKYYINGVTLTAPSGDTPRTFTITVPDGNSTDTVTFRFSVDKNYNVTVDTPE